MTWDQINDVAAQAAGIGRKRRQSGAIQTPARYTTATAEIILDGVITGTDAVVTVARCAHCGTHVELTSDERERGEQALVEIAMEADEVRA